MSKDTAVNIVDAQDPLPEARWVWRRVFTYGLSIALIVSAFVGVDFIGKVALAGSETAIAGLVAITKGSLWLLAMLILFYLLAPSAEQLTKLIQTGAALRSGVNFRSSAHTETERGATVDAETEVGTDLIPGSDHEASVGPEKQTELPVKAKAQLPWEAGEKA